MSETKPESLSRSEQSPEVSDAIEQVEAAKSFTPKADLIEHFGEDRLVQNEPDGPYRIRLKSWREVQEFDEMDRPRARLETEQAQRAYAKVPVVLLRSSTGRTWEVPETLSKTLCDSALGRSLGVHEVPRVRRFAFYAVNGSRVERVGG